MKALFSRWFPMALTACWAAFVLLRAGPSWLPGPGYVREIINSFLKNAGEGGGLSFFVSYHGGMVLKTAVLHLVQALFGAALVRWLVPRAARDWAVYWGAGFALMNLLTLGWGLAGALFPSAVFGSTALAAAASAVALRRGRVRGRPSPRLENGPADGWTRFLALVAGAAALVLLGLALPPDVSWDAVVYHLPLPAFFIEEHRIFHVPVNHFSAFPLAAEMQGTWLMLWGGVASMGTGSAMKLYHLSCVLLTAYAASRLVAGAVPAAARRPAGLLAAALVLLCPLTGTIGVRAYNDFLQGALAGLALCTLVEGRRGALRLAGAICGGAFAAKYTAVFMLVPLAAFWFRLRWVPYAAVGAFAAPWMLKNLLLTGDPVAPFLAGLFPVAPTTALQFASYTGSVSAMSMEFTRLGSVILGLIRTHDGESLSELLFILPLVPFALRTRGALSPVVGRYFALAMAAWFILAPSGRFFGVGLAPLAALAAAGFLSAERAAGAPVRWPLGALLVLNLVRLPLTHVSLFLPLPFTAGVETVEHYLGRTLYPVPDYGPMIAWANENLPPKARLILMIDIKAHYLWRRTYHDFQYVRPGLFLRWLREAGSAEGLVKRLRQEGVSHVLVVYQRTRDVGLHYSWQDGELTEAARFLSSFTRLIHRQGRLDLLEISRTPLPRRDIDDYNWLLFIHVENLMLDKREVEASELLRETMRRSPWLRGLHSYLGMTLARMENFQAAAPELAAGVRQGGATAPFAAFVLAQVRWRLGDRKGSEEALRDVTRLQPENADAHFELGRLMAERRAYGEAMREFQAALALAPGKPEYLKAMEEAKKRVGRR